MKFKNQDQLLDLIKKAVDQRAQEEMAAVFDADGTLWKEDANQILLDYQIEREKQSENSSKAKAVSKRRGFSDLLSEYYQKNHRHKLCQLFLKKQAGFSLAEFQAQSERALAQAPLTVFPFQRELLSYLKKQNIKIVVITASIQELVELAVKKYDLPVDQVLGCQAEPLLSENLKSHFAKSLLLKTLKAENPERESSFLKRLLKAFRIKTTRSKYKFSQDGIQKLLETAPADLRKLGLDKFDLKQEIYISDSMIRPSPGKDSKGEVFLKEHPKNSLLLAAGNTPSDLPLLELASFSFVTHSAKKGDIIFSAEQKMKELALAKKWLIFEKE